MPGLALRSNCDFAVHWVLPKPRFRLVSSILVSTLGPGGLRYASAAVALLPVTKLNVTVTFLSPGMTTGLGCTTTRVMVGAFGAPTVAAAAGAVTRATDPTATAATTVLMRRNIRVTVLPFCWTRLLRVPRLGLQSVDVHS